LHVSEEEIAYLIAPYSEDEGKRAIFQMEHKKPPSTAGFPVEFY
jgi:hypothetical protein